MPGRRFRQMREMRSGGGGGGEAFIFFFFILRASQLHSRQAVSVLLLSALSCIVVIFCFGEHPPPAPSTSLPALPSNRSETLQNHTRRPDLHYFAKPASRGERGPVLTYVSGKHS